MENDRVPRRFIIYSLWAHKEFTHNMTEGNVSHMKLCIIL